MNDSVKAALNRLGWLTFWDRNLTTPAALLVPAINELIHELSPAWNGTNTAFLGPVLDSLSPMDGTEYRAAVLVPDGVGVIVWSSAENDAAEQLKRGEIDELTAEFIRFERCRPEVQQGLLPHIASLLERIYQRLNTGKEVSGSA